MPGPARVRDEHVVEGYEQLGKAREGGLLMTVAQHVEERANLQVGEERMTEMSIPVDLVAVATAFLDPHQEALRNKVGDDLLGGPLADPDVSCDLANPDCRVASDAKQHVAVVRQHEPG